jgi:protein-L-isoaspartate(D-aspartate) O-methyltransferase
MAVAFGPVEMKLDHVSTGPNHVVGRAKPCRAPAGAQQRLLDALRDVPRSGVYSRPIPDASVVALMVGGLELTGSERVLEIGTGSGYQAAVLGRLARQVHSIEIDPTVADEARQTLERLESRNVQVSTGDASNGWSAAAPYDAILVGVGARELPSELIQQLVTGGRLVVPLGDEKWQLIERLRTRVDGVDCETLGGCRLEMLRTPRKVPSRFPWSRDSQR